MTRCSDGGGRNPSTTGADDCRDAAAHYPPVRPSDHSVDVTEPRTRLRIITGSPARFAREDRVEKVLTRLLPRALTCCPGAAQGQPRRRPSAGARPAEVTSVGLVRFRGIRGVPSGDVAVELHEAAARGVAAVRERRGEARSLRTAEPA
jgi:hypothetical protein